MTLFISDKNVETCKFRTEILATLCTYEVAVAEWLAHWLHMQEVRGSNPGQGNFFCCKILQNPTKIWRPGGQLCHFQSYLFG